MLDLTAEFWADLAAKAGGGTPLAVVIMYVGHRVGQRLIATEAAVKGLEPRLVAASQAIEHLDEGHRSIASRWERAAETLERHDDELDDLDERVERLEERDERHGHGKDDAPAGTSGGARMARRTERRRDRRRPAIRGR